MGMKCTSIKIDKKYNMHRNNSDEPKGTTNRTKRKKGHRKIVGFHLGNRVTQ